MAINRNYYKTNYQIDNIRNFQLPPWHCPYCKIGILNTNKNNLIYGSLGKDEVEYEQFRNMCGLLMCNNHKCQRSISFCGILSYVIEDTKETEENLAGVIEKTYFIPTYFTPYVSIFEIKESFPERIASLLEQAFSLFWCDENASANKIRSIIELILSYKKIPINHTLHKRINMFRVKNQDLADNFMAIKWIGNAGSHIGNINKDDLLDGYELLEKSLNLMYDKTEIKLIIKRNRIIRRKKPLSRK